MTTVLNEENNSRIQDHACDDSSIGFYEVDKLKRIVQLLERWKAVELKDKQK